MRDVRPVENEAGRANKILKVWRIVNLQRMTLGVNKTRDTDVDVGQ